MNFATWEAIARRQAWYVIVLEKTLAEWPKERIDACADLETLRGVLTLARRVDRHEQLMIRHLSKAVACDSLPGDQSDAAATTAGASVLRADHCRDPLVTSCQNTIAR